MAITSYDVTCDKVGINNSSNSSKWSSGSRMLKVNFPTDGSLSSATSRSEKSKAKKHEPKSPYLTGDRVQLLSRVTEKRFVHKKTMDYVSSFPLAVNIYKANSDELKSLKRANKKTKKSVLTLPNKPTPVLQICTASDMNDSEYYSQTTDVRKPRIKKRTAIKNVRKPPGNNKSFEFYDRDAQYCSQLNINLDSSSTDLIKNHKGDGKRISSYPKKKSFKTPCSPARKELEEDDTKPHDVWTMLRSMNRFQFNTSPPMSEESLAALKKNKSPKKRISRKDTRVIETCRTEEIAYISSYNVDESTHSLTQSSSFDRVTVINKQDEFSKICKQFEEGFLKTSFLHDPNLKNRADGKNKQKKKVKKVNTAPNNAPKENYAGPLQIKHNDLISKTQKGQKCYQNHSSDENRDDLSVSNIDDSKVLADSELTSVCSNTNKSIVDCGSDPIKDFFTYSDNSKSSKAEIAVNEAKLKEKKSREPSPNGRMPLMKGISGMIFGKESQISNPAAIRRTEMQRRKPRLVTTMPSACMMPKLTHAEIKRRLASMRFPIVILGKDQVSSSIEVQNYDPPQFDGLDKQIWPFMLEWQGIKQNIPKTVIPQKNTAEAKKNEVAKKFNTPTPDVTSSKLKKNNNEVINRQPNCKNKKSTSHDSDTLHTKNKIEHRRLPIPAETNSKPNKKQKSIINLKDKMLNLLYKKISEKSIDSYEGPQNKSSKFKISAPNKVDASTETCNAMLKDVSKPTKLRSPGRSPSRKTKRSGTGYPWAKAKWASDFIENVIRKIKNGVYYSQDHKSTKRVMETSIQTDLTSDQEDTNYDVFDFSPKVTITKKHQDNCKAIPGFDNCLPGLEIKTLNMNQIAVKHCVTNVMMQFDVTVPADTNQTAMSPKTSSSLIPVEITESYTKIFKCKTTILNAMLPAELCSLIPKLMNLIDPQQKIAVRPAYCPGIVATASHLSTISEMSRNEVTTTESIRLLPFVSSVHNYMSPAIKQILRGMFAKTQIISKERCVVAKTIPVINSFDFVLIIDLLPKVTIQHDIMYTQKIELFIPVIADMVNNNTAPYQSNYLLTDLINNQGCTCTSLELYTNRNKKISTLFEPYNFATSIRNVLNSQTIHLNRMLFAFLNVLKIQYDGNIINFNMNIQANNGVKKSVSLTIKHLKIDSVKDEEACEGEFGLINKSLEFEHESSNNYNLLCKGQQSETEITANNKSKRKGFYRINRKCKSTTTISTMEKYNNTPLNQIQNLDDFFHLLGSKKILASVFDGYSAKKILSSLVQMKNWISDINSRQALLILLLTNKKDTPNLVRFRPILLQGIAVNRITRSTELDMEIEVIEREHFNKLSEASDYQRPFDDSSENLLKSLLEKRKKLNPSYLRVMARYVGLGLLKSPIKK
ncbi:uncharacterized protein LOC142978982 isoform X1 [Anticarsia gemmatalis]|uniref:uncharacterized protein LOC142978982 isoform X1 n=2 Tax=Anticarsia gemmatalis TaxID=129554 RepID=UPI003F7713B0